MDDWQTAIARYLVRCWRMGPVGVYDVLRKCEFDEAMRARFLRLAGVAGKLEKNGQRSINYLTLSLLAFS